MRVFCLKDYAQEFNFLYNWNRATIQEKLWVRVKFTETTKMNAYGRERDWKTSPVQHSCLPPNMRNSPSVNSFKSALKTYLFSV